MGSKRPVRWEGETGGLEGEAGILAFLFGGRKGMRTRGNINNLKKKKKPRETRKVPFFYVSRFREDYLGRERELGRGSQFLQRKKGGVGVKNVSLQNPQFGFSTSILMG